MAALFSSAHGQQPPYPSESVIAQLGEVAITLGDVDAMASQLPDEVRAGVFDSPKRIGETLETMLVRRAMVAPLLDNPPPYLDLQSIEAAARHKTLVTQALSNAIKTQSLPDFTAQALAYYENNPAEFVQPASVSVRHILIDKKSRSTTDAYQRANDVRSQLISGGLSFDQAVEQYSDDPARNQNKGRYRRVLPGAMVPEFEAASFALEKVGDISSPVRTKFGYHLILLEDKHAATVQPKESAVPNLSASYFQEHLRTRKMTFLKSLGDDPEGRLLQLAMEQGVQDLPDFEVHLRLELEEAVLRAYKEHYLKTQTTGNFDALAKEYYLAHKKEFMRPAAATAVQIEVPKSDNPYADLADIQLLQSLAQTNLGAQVVLALTPPNTRAEQVVYIDGERETARGAKIAFSIKQSGDCADRRDLTNSYLIICLIQKHPEAPKSFVEIRRPLVARLRAKQETKMWTLHINEFHQLPFQADEPIVASLRTRYVSGNHAG